MKYTTEAYLIQCLTNMHVGSGDTDYGVVDNLVQRNPITEVPTIHSSSLKGALREYFSTQTDISSDTINYVFGGDAQRSETNESKEQIGHYKFFQADMIVYPVRSNKKPFRRATASFLLDDILAKANSFRIDNVNEKIFAKLSGDNSVEEGKPLVQHSGERLEGLDTSEGLVIEANNILGQDLALFHEADFKKLIKKLPTIARNQLTNGVSQNLWYEEIVPRESRFLFFVSKPENNSTDTSLSDFEKILDDCVVQIGANGSIGYGFCSIQKINGYE
ncbi:MAG: type III-B CRISPR module RAMP protein Cmr4 [Bacteroidota bacterium]